MRTQLCSIVHIACLFIAIHLQGQNLPSTPVTVTVSRADESVFNASLSGVPGGFDVGNNTYLAWCVDIFNTNNPTFNRGVHNAVLIDTFATNLPAPFAGKPWDKINYLLNHKQGGSGDIQAALWHFTDGFAPDPVSNPMAVLMVQDTEAHGAGYVPGPSNVVAVALVWQGADAGFQHVIIETTAGTASRCCDRFTVCGSLRFPTNSVSLSIQGKCENGKLSGCLTLVDCAGKVRVKSRRITSYTVLDANCRRATFDVDINGRPGTATVRACDYRGTGQKDFVDITLSTGYGVAGEVGVRVEMLKCDIRCSRCGGKHWTDSCRHKDKKGDCECDKDKGVVLTTILPNGNLKATFVQAFWVNDNTYGANAYGWGGPNKHSFKNLLGSDNIEWQFKNSNGQVVLQFSQDYISATKDTVNYPSGYASLGFAGDGDRPSAGMTNWLISYSSSLAENLNKQPFLGNLAQYTVDSPASNDVNSAQWEYRATYTVEISASAFSGGGFGSVAVVDQHNSPAKKCDCDKDKDHKDKKDDCDKPCGKCKHCKDHHDHDCDCDCHKDKDHKKDDCECDKDKGVVLTTILPNGNVKATFVQAFGVNDNTYGANAYGWGGPNKHKFRDLVGSDRVEWQFKNSSGQIVLQFDQDYIGVTNDAVNYPSGYASLGFAGDGDRPTVGMASWLVSYSSSLAENLNKQPFLGNLAQYTVDSPASNDVNSAQWEYRAVYTVEISASAFSGGFGSAAIVEQHNSPEKRCECDKDKDHKDCKDKDHYEKDDCKGDDHKKDNKGDKHKGDKERKDGEDRH